MTPEPAKMSLAGTIKDWSTYSAIGTFLLYLFGYLALRFHITALGILTDLGVLDERYLFAGAKFFVFFAACLPVLALMALPVAAVVLPGWRWLPLRWKKRISDVSHHPGILLWTSLILAVAAIQFWMNACFGLYDLALASKPPEPQWLNSLLRSHDEIDMVVFFIKLLVCAAAVCAPVIAASRLEIGSLGLRMLFGAAAALAVVILLLIPVNFGTVIMPYSMARTSAIGKTPVPAGQEAWLLWEGKDWMTYLVKSPTGRSVVAVPVKEIDRIEVTGSDSLFDVLYGSPAGGK